MEQRFISLWFRHLTTDWFTLRRPALRNIPFVLAAPDHGRKVIMAANPVAQGQGIYTGMVIADARVLVPAIEVIDDIPALPEKLLHALGLWCVRYTPITGVDLPDGLILDITGCAHLWGGERPYLKDLLTKLRTRGYDVRAAMAGTVGSAWAIARFGRITAIIEPGMQAEAMLALPPRALRLEEPMLERLQKLGLTRIGDIAGIQRSALRRRFGKGLLLRLDQAFGKETETIQPVQAPEPYQERLPCLEPIQTAGGIEIALTRLLDMLCFRLEKEGKGLRTAVFKCFRVDGNIQQISIGTNRGTHNSKHLFKLFEPKIETIEPDLGFELFTLDAPKTEDVSPQQVTLWTESCGLEDTRLSELLDRLTNKSDAITIRRYLPDEHHWPERSVKPVSSLQEKPSSPWLEDVLRPIYLLPKPEPVQVTAPVPDYPPMNFRYKGKLHTIKRADGPERIEHEWWLEDVLHRDYYCVEDEEGGRYWLFRSGHYGGDKSAQWYIHGFFA